jgi:hypothetical protein
MPLNTVDRMLRIVAHALDGADDAQGSLSPVIRKCIRIARARNDFDNLWWLEQEMTSPENVDDRRRVMWEIMSHYTTADVQLLHTQLSKAYNDERKQPGAPGPNPAAVPVCTFSVHELETRAVDANAGQPAAAAPAPAVARATESFFLDRALPNAQVAAAAVVHDAQGVLDRVRCRVLTFLERTEIELLFGQLHSGRFEQNRRFVDDRMSSQAPEAVERLGAVHRRPGDTDPAGRTQALGACRALLLALAHTVLPADGEQHAARLARYVTQRTAGAPSVALLLERIADLGRRVDSARAGGEGASVPDVSGFEASDCVTQTYLVIGDVLRLHEGTSALLPAAAAA